MPEDRPKLQVSAATPETTVDRPGPGLPGEPRRRHKALLLIVVVVVLIAAGVGVALADPFSSDGKSQPGLAGNADRTALYTVARGDLSSQTQVPATLGYAGSYAVVNQAQGILTALPSVGQVVAQGKALYQVNGAPVVLLYGQAPAYRSLSMGLAGVDVAELNADLVSLGDATTTEIPAGSNTFTAATATALKKLQAALGVAESGTLTLGQAVFLPGPLRVTTASGQPGGPAPAGQAIIEGTSTTRQVAIALDAAQQSEVKAGDKVSITLPNNQTTPGVISSVGTVATTPPSSRGGGGAPATPTITVLVKPTDPAATGTWDQAPVNVTITTGTVTNALVVPVDALLAQPRGGYAVEVVDPQGIHRLVAVTLGLFDDADGLVQVSGPGLAAGQRVVVPKL